MRKILFMALFTAAIFMVTTACNKSGDDDETQYSEMSQATKAAWINATAGTFTGKLHYINPNTNQEDSLDASWTIKNDSCMTISLPVKQTSIYASSTIIKQALAETESQTMRCTLHAYMSANSDYYTYWMIPDTNKLSFSTKTETSSDDFIITFGDVYNYYYGSQSTAYYPICAYIPATKEFIGYIIVSQMSINGTDTGANTVWRLTGKKTQGTIISQD